MQSAYYLRLAAGLGTLAVALGAFGAHGLKTLVDAPALDTFQTGVRYHFYHTFAIAIAALLAGRSGFSERWLTRAVGAWAIGILLFSGSLYLLTLRDYHPVPAGLLGPITPLGGLAFIAGWVMLGLSSRRA